jgi:hypothetical protein
MKQYYIKATGSVCYNWQGLTYPEDIAISWDGLLLGLNAKWEFPEGLSNLPLVLTFTATEEDANAVNEILQRDYPVRLLVLVNEPITQRSRRSVLLES